MSEPSGCFAHARALELQGDNSAAAAVLDSVPIQERTALWHYARGAMALKSFQLDEAIALFREAVRREPDIPEYRSNLGAALLEKRKAGDIAAGQEALLELERAIKAGPHVPEVYANLALARLAAGDAAGALSSAEVGLRMHSRHVPCLYNRAAALNALGHRHEALATLNQLLAIDSSCAPAMESRAHLQRLLGI